MTTADTATIEIPRLPDETPRAYAARVEYLTMGAGRSLDALAQKYNKSRSLFARWSVAHEWGEHARRYDDTMVTLRTQAVAQAAAEEYRKALEDHRQRYGEAGKRLYTAATVLLNACSQAVVGTVIKDEKGQVHHIPKMEMTPGAFSVALRALTTAADLEAHALRVADLLPRLTSDDQPDR